MSGDVNQMVQDGILEIADVPRTQQIMGVDEINPDFFGDELATHYSGMDGGWFITAASAYIGFFVLLYFTLYQWVQLYRDRNRLKSGML